MKTKELKPCHLFNYQGCWYVIDIDGMSARAIDEMTAGVLEKTAGNRDSSISSPALLPAIISLPGSSTE